ncbi:hypothetical protein [Kitasatospora sp. NPDC088134]|uniref:hypothetical protein n=1 Tax=Kitasatospora sp. NPDC088134 TaxID=3364071 RepID=UPI00381B5854
MSIRTQDGTGDGHEDDPMVHLAVDVLVAVVLTTVEVVALLLAGLAIGIKAWADNKSGRGTTPGLKRIALVTAALSLILPAACAYALHLPTAAIAQCLLLAAIPFQHPIVTGANRLREGMTRHRRR